MLGKGSLHWLMSNKEEVLTRLANVVRKDSRPLNAIAKEMGISATTLLEFIKDRKLTIETDTRKKKKDAPSIRTLLKIEKYILEKEKSHE